MSSSEAELGPAVTAVLDQIPCVAGDREILPLVGGTSNRTYLIESGGCRAVLRIPASDDSALGVDRHAEHANAVAANRAGIGPRVYSPPRTDGILVLEWLDGV